MFAKEFLVLFAVTICLVAANPFLQALQSQTCPICQQNNQMNPAQLIQMLLQPPAQNIQSYPQGVVAQNPAPCQPQIQNQGPYFPCQPNNQVNPCSNNNQGNSNLINKILSNPALKNILDPNTQFFNQNGEEMCRNCPNGNAVPSVVNNYIIVPPEFLLEDCKCDTNEGQKIEERRGRNKSNSQGRRRQERNGDRRDNRSRAANVDKTEEECQIERKPRRRQKNKNPEIKVKVVNENATQPNNQIETPKVTADEAKDICDKKETTTDFNNFLEEFVTTTPISEIISGQEDLTNQFKFLEKSLNDDKELSEYNNAKCPTPETQISQPITIEVKEKECVAEQKHRNKVKATIKQRNDREEAAIQDFRRKFPNIPEDVVRNLLDHMKKQIEKEQLGVPAFYYPQFPIQYEQLYKPVVNYPASNDSQRKNKRRRNGRRKTKRRKSTTTSKPIITTTETEPTIANEIEVTTVPVSITKTIPINDEVTTKPTTVSEYVTELVVAEHTTVKPNHNVHEDINGNKETNVPELGSEDVVPTMYLNGLIDEYYPDFTMDNRYFSNEDLSLYGFDNNRYHYTTDKNYKLEELNRERRRYETNSENKFRRPERIVFRLRKGSSTTRPSLTDTLKFENQKISSNKFTNFERTTENPKIIVTLQTEDSNHILSTPIPLDVKAEPPKTVIQEVHFQTPPTLETIDFETKQINKDSYYKHDYIDKVSSFSEAKTPQYNTDMNGRKVEKTKPKDQIETVFARSKVVTYGKPSQEESSEELLTNDDLEKTSKQDDKTLVFAKSVAGFW